ncbi:Catalase HPII [Variovorax sp. WDL1]|uniref:catalase HPII n=1 Tax=Variovorax sp. WDL1 TaxID=207745 RepID=UPI00076C593F|nr:Catalase [Variovorax sp. WDL1]PNG51610.1 Catalase HPII [Variovorax sp. B2]PNG54364.1 Catalase HPII [Variovorax sp. B4]VTV11861.1 Catalase HPII [Variovorax sp. WDL1]
MTPAKKPSGSRRPKPTNGSNDKLEQLAESIAENTPRITTNQGVQIPDNHNSLRAGVRGPSLLEDFILREKITHFDHERIPERVVHARGEAAHGYFEVYKSMSQFTSADFLQDPSVKTPVFVRFSTVAGSRGSADTVRDVRGFAVKFYTREGNYDLVGNNIPVFFIQDAIKFPDLIHAVKPEPHHEMPQAASAHDTFWDFASLMPETTHMLMWIMSDRAIPRSLRMMEGFGVHSFRFVNARGESHFVKFHWKPKLGIHGLAWDEAQKISGKDPDFHRRDLWEAIERGDFPEWELGVQMIPQDKEHSLPFDLLDPTKLIPEEMVPVQRIGRLVLNRNPDNFFAETEQVAFHPGHLVPGIDFTNDPLLQGRLFSYTDTQLSRLGGPNFHELPINKSVCPFHNFQRDGMHRQAIARGHVAYEPHSLNDGKEFRIDGGSAGFQSFPEEIETPKVRRRSPSFDDHFTQARLFFNSQSVPEKEHIIAAFRFELSKVAAPIIRQRMVDNLALVDEKLARRVAEPLGIGAPDPKAAAGRAGYREHRMKLPIEESPALRMVDTGDGSIKTRQVAILAMDGIDSASLKPIREAIEQAGAQCKVVGPRLGTVTSASKRQLEVDATFLAMPSVMFDAVLVPAGAPGAEAMARNGDAVHFVLEAYKHCKAICTVGEGVQLLSMLGIGTDANAFPPGVVVAATPTTNLGDNTAAVKIAHDFVAAIAKHRHWDRPGIDGVPA